MESFVSGSPLCIATVMSLWGCISPEPDTHVATSDAKGILLPRSLCLNLTEVMLKLGSLSALVVTCVHVQMIILDHLLHSGDWAVYHKVTSELSVTLGFWIA